IWLSRVCHRFTTPNFCFCTKAVDLQVTCLRLGISLRRIILPNGSGRHTADVMIAHVREQKKVSQSAARAAPLAKFAIMMRYQGKEQTTDIPSLVNYEEFLGYLDIEYHLGLRGSDTWSDDGNEAQVVAKTLIGQVIAERMPSKKAIPQLYLNFVRKLRPGDTILTFNCDVLLEHALYQIPLIRTRGPIGAVRWT